MFWRIQIFVQYMSIIKKNDKVLQHFFTIVPNRCRQTLVIIPYACLSE